MGSERKARKGRIGMEDIYCNVDLYIKVSSLCYYLLLTHCCCCLFICLFLESGVCDVFGYDAFAA